MGCSWGQSLLLLQHCHSHPVTTPAFSTCDWGHKWTGKKIKEKICFWAQRCAIKGNTQKTTCLVTSPERVCQGCDMQVWSAPITTQITSNHKPYVTTNHKHWFSQTAGALWSQEHQECSPLHAICVKVVTEWAGPPRVLGCLETSLPKPGYFLWGAGDWSKASRNTTNGQ